MAALHDLHFPASRERSMRAMDGLLRAVEGVLDEPATELRAIAEADQAAAAPSEPTVAG